ncbi:MAG: hypothetical protein WC543_03080 [Candidatus Omnitrophota bacterium]
MRRFIWILLTVFFILVALIIFLFSQYRFNSALNQTRQRLMLIATNAAISIDADQLQKIPLLQSSEGTPEYMVVYNKLVKIKEANPSFVKYAYIMTTTDQPYILQYIADADPTPQIITARCPTSLPGDKYDASLSPELLRAYDGPTAEKKITTDVWGTFISGYAPIRDLNGKSVAILGVDSDATALQAMQKDLKVTGTVVLIAGVVFLLSFLTLIKFEI